MVVYGPGHEPAHEDLKAGFLAELSVVCQGIDCPYIVGGDFNILRHVLEKNKPIILAHSSALFNSVIHTLCLREIHMAGGLYTWSDKRSVPTLEKMDRVLMSTCWENIFLLSP